MAMTPMSSVEPFVDATPLLSDPAALRAQAEESGYLFFPGLLDQDPVRRVRQQMLELCRAHGWLEPESDPDAGIARRGEPVIESTQDPRFRAFYDDAQRLRDFHALALEAPIVQALEVLFGEAVLPHPRNILRVIWPQTATHSTPPHQDHFYIGGSRDTWTCWFPLGDCPADLGSLAVLPGSHRRGFLETHAAPGAGGRAVAVEGDDAWAGGDFACGDVLLLHSLTIHQGRDNRTDRLRLSCDFRYQPRSQPVRADSLVPHLGWLTWEEIYAAWPADDPLRHYWSAWDLDITQRETTR
jgi:ectoine hydroxylase-related dioxygenase (phytanoyl-CoA dioxygenase family)